MDEDELLARAAEAGYTVVHTPPCWRVVDADRAWQPAMHDRASLLRLLATRLAHVGADPNAIPG